MKITLGRIMMWMAVMVTCPASIWGQEATTNRNVILRRDPSTTSPVLEHLAKGDRLMLVDAKPDSGFYHVRTEDDQVGWILSKYVSLSPTPPSPGPGTPSAPSGETCDPMLEAHVYHPQRLIVKQACIAVTGTNVDATANEAVKQPDGVRHEKDGDTHGWLKVDPAFENLLNAGNISDEGGNLVFEIICRFPVTQADAKAACQGYTDRVTLPPVGAHVRMVGRYVQDTFHAKWNEIHPVTSIGVVP